MFLGDIDFVNFIPITAEEKRAKKMNFREQKFLEKRLKCIKKEEQFSRNILKKKHSMVQTEIEEFYKSARTCFNNVKSQKEGMVFLQMNRCRSAKSKYQNLIRPTMMNNSIDNRPFNQEIYNACNSSGSIKWRRMSAPVGTKNKVEEGLGRKARSVCSFYTPLQLSSKRKENVSTNKKLKNNEFEEKQLLESIEEVAAENRLRTGQLNEENTRQMLLNRPVAKALSN